MLWKMSTEGAYPPRHPLSTQGRQRARSPSTWKYVGSGPGWKENETWAQAPEYGTSEPSAFETTER